MDSDAEQQAKLKKILDEAWREYRFDVIARVEALRVATNQARSGTLDEPARALANSTAHKLAGVLGTFGMREASQMASRIEMLLEPGATPAETLATSLDQILDSIDRAIIQRDAA